jgi:hypothetical protein
MWSTVLLAIAHHETPHWRWWAKARNDVPAKQRRRSRLCPPYGCSETPAAASLPGLTRQSITLRRRMDARIKSAHDGIQLIVRGVGNEEV